MRRPAAISDVHRVAPGATRRSASERHHRRFWTDQHPHARRRPLGFSLPALIGLAALGLPRVVLHDLHLVDQGNGLNWILALGPVVVWIVVAVVKRVPNPFLTVLVIGAIFGLML